MGLVALLSGCALVVVWGAVRPWPGFLPVRVWASPPSLGLLRPLGAFALGLVSSRPLAWGILMLSLP